MYEIKNNINGKIYVGVHKTKVEDDGYMGSGKVIKRAIEKHGIENFTKTILERFETADEMYAREKEVVNEKFLARDDVYNLRRGGYGGFDHINRTGLNTSWKDPQARIEKYSNSLSIRLKEDRHLKTLFDENLDLARKKLIELERGYMDPEKRLLGSNNARSEVSREKRKQTMELNGHQKGDKNSQFGSMWITNDIVNRKIKKDDAIPDGWKRGRFSCV